MMRGWLALLMCATLLASSIPAAESTRITLKEAAGKLRQPQVAIDEEGRIHVAFGVDQAVYVSSSENAGSSFRGPVKIATVPRLALGARRGPRIVAARGTLVVTAISHQDGQVLAWRSRDDGQSWSGPVTVNDAAKSAVEGLHAMAAGPSGQIYCVWLDLRNKSTQLYGAVSTDGGKRWSKNQQIYVSPSGSICECCHPAVAYDSAGGLHIMWRNSLRGERNMYLVSSTDGGKKFAPPQKLGSTGWKLEACPMDGGYLAAAQPGKVTTVWRRQEEVLRTDGDKMRERSLGRGEQPWAAATAQGPYLVWLGRRFGDLWLLTPGSAQPQRLAGSANDPVIAAPLQGDGPVVVAWESGRRGATEIEVRVVKP